MSLISRSGTPTTPFGGFGVRERVAELFDDRSVRSH